MRRACVAPAVTGAAGKASSLFDAYPLVVLAPCMGASANCLAHLIACRLASRRGRYYPLIVGFLIGLLFVLAVSLAALRSMGAALADCAALLVLNLSTYLGLAFGYFCFVNLNIASLRIRMLQELLQAGGSLPKERLLACYNTDEVIALRINRLLRGRHLLQKQERVYSGRRHFLLVGRIFDVLRWMILGSKTPAAGSAPVPGEISQRPP